MDKKKSLTSYENIDDTILDIDNKQTINTTNTTTTTTTNTTTNANTNTNTTRRGRGRPRKNQIVQITEKAKKRKL